MSVLYSVVGAAAPLVILISFLFPMLVLALCLVYLTRQAPSGGGIFTFSSRFLHPMAGTILGWAYTLSCVAVVPRDQPSSAPEYLQALLPALKEPTPANIDRHADGSRLHAGSAFARAADRAADGGLPGLRISVIVGLGLLGIASPHVAMPLHSLYTLPKGLDGARLGRVLLGMWMLANFDSAINYIEEARVPVRTVQRALLIVLTSACLIYTIAAIGWQYAVPVDVLAKIAENGDGGPVAAVARVYRRPPCPGLPSSWSSAPRWRGCRCP